MITDLLFVSFSLNCVLLTTYTVKRDMKNVTLHSITILYQLGLQAAIAQMSDVQLLEELCSTEEDEHHYDQFVKRFLADVQKHCNAVCIARSMDKQVGQQIAHEVFERVRKYKTYSKDGSTLPDNRKAILVYLKRIATNLFNDYYNRVKKRDIPHRSYFDDIFEAARDKIDVKALKDKKDVALTIFKKLNKKEQTVVLKDIEYKKHQKYLPDDVTADLAHELKVRPDSIRKIRARAIEKIKSAIDEINKN